MNKVRTAMIIGGGIAGPVAALALRKAGIEATVHEAYDTVASGVGGGLSIAPNGVNALAVIGADTVLRDIGNPIETMAMHNWKGRKLGEFGSPAGLPPQRFVWRSELYRVLYEEATRRGVHIEHGKRLTGLDQTPDAVTAHFADGSSASADILIGADGIRSTVRGLIDPNAPGPRYVGLLGFGGAVANPNGTPGGNSMHFTFGKRAFFGHAFFDDGTGGWFSNLPSKEPLSANECKARDPQQWIDELCEQYADDRYLAVDLLRRTDPADLLCTGPLEDIPTVPTWSSGRVVLIGDAAHATSPSSGQGASLACESAVVLAKALRDLPHQQAFASYEDQRRDRVERVIAQAARTNNDKAAGPVARVLRDALMPVVLKFAKPEKFTWQFDYRIDWDARADALT